MIILHELAGRSVKRLNNIATKSGRGIHLDEFDALNLATQLRLPVPCPHEALRISDDEVSIRMDFVEGRNLDDVWPNMSNDEKHEICSQLRDVLKAMRSAQPSTGVIGSCSGGIVRDCRRLSDYTGGPFPEEESFNSFILNLVKATLTAIREALEQRLRSDHCIVFTHGDLTQHNIIVKDNKITGLVDWEYAGCHPEYWEYIKFFDRHTRNRDWKDYAKDIFPQTYDDELVLFQAISRWQLP